VGGSSLTLKTESGVERADRGGVFISGVEKMSVIPEKLALAPIDLRPTLVPTDLRPLRGRGIGVDDLTFLEPMTMVAGESA